MLTLLCLATISPMVIISVPSSLLSILIKLLAKSSLFCAKLRGRNAHKVAITGLVIVKLRHAWHAVALSQLGDKVPILPVNLLAVVIVFFTLLPCALFWTAAPTPSRVTLLSLLILSLLPLKVNFLFQIDAFPQLRVIHRLAKTINSKVVDLIFTIRSLEDFNTFLGLSSSRLLVFFPTPTCDCTCMASHHRWLLSW